MMEVVNLSSKGQLVIPKNMREEMGLHAKDKFVLVNDRDTIILKRIEEQKIKNRMKQLMSKFRADFKKAGITKQDVEAEIKAVRKRK